MCKRKWVADRLFVNEDNWSRAGGWKYTVPCIRDESGKIVALCGKPPAFMRVEDGSWVSEEDVVLMASSPDLLRAATNLCRALDQEEGVDFAKAKMKSVILKAGGDS